MNDRIKALSGMVLKGEMHTKAIKTEFNDMDLLLPEAEKDKKRLCEYIMNQEPVISELSKFTGFFTFDGSVVGDAFNRSGHRNTEEILFSRLYLKPIDNLMTHEWQHATADYKKLLKIGLGGIIDEIDESLQAHNKPEEIEFLTHLRDVAGTVIKWANKCSERVSEFAVSVQNPEYKENLKKLSVALMNVPKKSPESFYEAVLSVYICFSCDPDSLGTLDRYLSSFYDKDIKNGVITRDEAKEYLQELFLMVQTATPFDSPWFTRGGQSHFCVGGYLPDGNDGFCDMSRLIVESLMELPTCIPQVTLRWTKKTPHEVFKFMMDCERKDSNKRIAFTSDEKRIKSYTEICGFPFEKAVEYTMVGCNEPAFVGAISGGANTMVNILHPVESVFHLRNNDVKNSKNFDEFYAIFEEELKKDVDKICDFDDKCNLIRARDINYVSSFLFNDCVENAKSLTQGGGNTAIASPQFVGIPNAIDSLAIVKQFVFEEKYIEMSELVDAVRANWEGHEDLRTVIIKKGKFFGNDDDLSNSVAQMLYKSFYDCFAGRKTIFGYPILVGDLIGYHEHHKWFGDGTKATPDGRFAGDAMKFGLGQGEGKDRNGLTALLNSVAKADPTGIGCGSTVTNVSIDEQLIMDDDNFEKTVDMFETYFKNGGVHFQLTYVSAEDLLNARKTPENYGNLRVRVSGFSENFVKLNDALQEDIIRRTTQRA